MSRAGILRNALAAAAGVACLFVGDAPSSTGPDTFVATAQARVGRPATPMSYAGVARRTTRRAVAVGAAAGAAAGGCVQVVDAYGRVATRCY
jgi:hypothetical protein